MAKVKIAIATDGRKGLGDEVAEHFAKAETFTIVTIEGKKAHVEIMENPAAKLLKGRGPTVVRLLRDNGVNTVVAGGFGSGSLALLRQGGFCVARVQPKVKVSEVIRSELYKNTF
ncbi:MAG: NifB/NifX family molybdenum-iron cluster-binding protein [Candidatus Hadarchaeum sp.]|uniref:NifB/NifX family molybdenum-iron cluster-binding protein n=1 Tax=Candidatus Hadarchaeum sp. TaxID=2883567 RepID=UPI0031737C25